MITLYQLGEFSIYFFFYIFIVMAIYQYIRVEKHSISAITGMVLILIVTVVYTIFKLYYPQYIPTLLQAPPVTVLACIYYLTYTRTFKKSRVTTIAALLVLLLLITIYILSAFNL